MSLTIELAQLPCRDGDVASNLSRAVQAMAACAPQTRLLVLPELFLTGFPTRSNVQALAEPLNGPSLTRICQAARDHQVSVALGMVESHHSRIYNTTVLITPEEGIALHYRKVHLFGGESEVFAAGDRFSVVDWNGLRIGLIICYDVEFPESARALAQLGADLLVITNGNMDPYAPVHRACVTARALENQRFALMANRVGGSDGRFNFSGGSAVVDPNGRFLAEAGNAETTLRVSLDLNALLSARQHYDYLHERRLGLQGHLEDHGTVRHLVLPTDNPAPGTNR